MRTSQIAKQTFDPRELEFEAYLDEYVPEAFHPHGFVEPPDPYAGIPFQELWFIGSVPMPPRPHRRPEVARFITPKTELMAALIRRTANLYLQDPEKDSEEDFDPSITKSRFRHLARKLEYCLLPSKHRCRLRLCPGCARALAKKRKTKLAEQMLLARAEYGLYHLTTTLASDKPTADFHLLMRSLFLLKRQRWFKCAVAGGVTRIDIKPSDRGEEASRRWNLHAHSVLAIRRDIGFDRVFAQQAWSALIGRDRRGSAHLTGPFTATGAIWRLAGYVTRVRPKLWLALGERPSLFIQFVQFFSNPRVKTFSNFGWFGSARTSNSEEFQG